jgi:hypothetical protein
MVLHRPPSAPGPAGERLDEPRDRGAPRVVARPEIDDGAPAEREIQRRRGRGSRLPTARAPAPRANGEAGERRVPRIKSAQRHAAVQNAGFSTPAQWYPKSAERRR